MNRGPEDSARLRPVRAGQRLTGAGQLSSLVTVQPALNLIVAGVQARQIAQGVSLEVDATLADCMTVWFGYDPAEAANNVQPTFDPAPSWPASAAAQPTRRIFGVVKWGVGGGQQYVELDVSEGVGVTIPTNVCEAYAYSESTNLTQDGREVDQDIEPQPWTVHVHAAPGRAAKEARRTRQVVQPYLIAPEELCPQGFNPDWCAFIDKTMDLIAGDGDGDGDGDEPLGYFDPMAIPVVSNASDEEFGTGTTMVLFDPNTIGTTFALSNSLLRVSAPATSPNRITGLYKPTPAGEFSAWAVLTSNRGQQNTSLCCMAICAALPTALVPLQLAFFNQSFGTNITQFYLQNYTDLNTFSSTLVNARNGDDGPHWIRLRYLPSSTRLSWDLSGDGVNWLTVYETTSPFVTPNYIILGGAGSVDATYNFDFLRFSNSAAPEALTLGKEV